MTTRDRRALLAVTAAAGAFAGAPAAASASETVFAVTADEELTSFSSDQPGRLAPPVKITGLQPGEDVEGIDVRAETGALYALGSTGRLYVVDPASGRATVASQLSVALSGSDFGVDFNPTVDRLRIVSDTGQNLRVNVDTGVAVVDGTLNPAGAKVTAAGYENAFPAATATRLLDIDSGTDRLRVQNPPNNGTLADVGPLGVDASSDVAMDIAPSDNAIYAAIRREGQSGGSTFYRVSSTTGAATSIGDVGAVLTGIAVARQSVTLHGVGAGGTLVSFPSTDPGSARTIAPITGLQAGETIEGIDTRPANGGLYALGSTGRLYLVNRTTAVATQVGTNVIALNGTSFGFDFNPTVDRIRLTSDAGQDLRLNPDDATIAATDPALNPAGVQVVGSAYTSSFAGATSTTLFNLDLSQNRLTRQDPPNAGTQVEVGPLGVTPSTADAGFDIAPQDDAAYAALTVGGTPGLYRPLLATGAARASGAIDPAVGPIDALAVADAGSLGLVAATARVSESAGAARLTLVRENGDGAATVTYAASEGVTASGSVSFLPGERLKDVVIPIADNATDEPDRTFKLTLTRGSGGYRLGATEAVVTVVDDDPAPAAAPAAPAPPVVAVPDTIKPIALVIGQDRKLATLRAKGVNVLYSVNEAASIRMTFRLGTTVVGTATTRRTAGGVARLNVKLTTAGKARVGKTRTRRLSIEAVVTDAAGNATTTRSTFLAKR